MSFFTLKCSFILVSLGFALFLTGFSSPLWNIFIESRYVDSYPLTTIGLWTFCYYIGDLQSCYYFNGGMFGVLIRVNAIFALASYFLTIIFAIRLLNCPNSSTLLVPFANEIIAVVSTVITLILWPTLFPLFRQGLSWSYWCTVLSVVATMTGIIMQATQIKRFSAENNDIIYIIA